MRLSLFTPTNNSAFLPEVYASIKDQDFDEWVIVYNNGAEPKEFNDARIKTMSDYGDGKVGRLKSKACALATGDILLELDHDDLLLPGACRKVKDAFNDNPHVGFVYSNAVHADKSFEPTERYDEKFGWRYRDYPFRGVTLDEYVTPAPSPEAVSRIWYAPNHLRAYRREAYVSAGGHDVTMRVLDDQDLMCRMFLITEFLHLDMPLYLYRIHGQNSWLQHNKEIQDNVYPIYHKYIERMVKVWAARKGLRCIELGAGINPTPGYEHVDMADAPILHDLNTYPWPFPDSSVGVIRAMDTFEHLKCPISVMKECQRVLAPGGWLMCQVPSTDGRGAFQDPTHVSFWNENSFLYYTNAHWAKYIRTPVRFQAPCLFTTAHDAHKVCWTVAHLINLKDGYRPPGLINI